MLSLSGKRDSNILFIVFIIVVLVNTDTVTSFINYSDERHDEQPRDIEPGEARTTRQMLESSDIWKIYKSKYTLQEATEHILQYGALLRNQILDTFGALVYDHYDDYSIGQTEALYRIYRETLERKYNLFNIIPSVLANSDTRPTKICRHIHKHVHTCLKESSKLCMTIKKHDNPHPHTASTSAVNVTRHVFKTTRFRRNYPNGFSLPAVLEYLKTGTLRLTVGLLSGLLHNVQYDSFDDEIRTAEKNVMTILMSEMRGFNEHQALMRQDQIQRIHTVSDLLKRFFESRRAIYDRKTAKNFAILAEHVVREVEAISQNIELFGSVYENDTIHMRFLFNLVLPPDVVDSDITEAKDYLLRKMDDYDIVKKYLKVEKYQQSGPDQLLMEILGQMRDINFAVDIATALHTHARFWHQSHMVNNLNELLELFDAYENLRRIKKFSHLMSLINEVRNSLWDSKNVTIEILCHNPRACLRLGLETVAECLLINLRTKSLLHQLFAYLSQDGSIYADNCKLPVVERRPGDVSETTRSPTILPEDMISEHFTRKRLETTEASIVETSTRKPTERSATTIEAEISTLKPSATTVITEIKLPKAVFNKTEHTTAKSTTDMRWELTEHPTETFTDEEIATTMATVESTALPHKIREIVDKTVQPTFINEQPTTVMPSRADETTTERLTTPGTSLLGEVEFTTEYDDTMSTTEDFEEPTTMMTVVMPGGNLVREWVSTGGTTSVTDYDCSDDDCIYSEQPEESTVTLSRAWLTNSTDPPLLLENLRNVGSTNLPTTVVAMTTTTTATTIETPTAQREMVTQAQETLSESTTAGDEFPGLSKKPKSYSVSASDEDCSGDGCNSSECSGDGCPSLSSREKSTLVECSDRNGGCSNEDEQECSNEGCRSTPTPSEDREDCIGEACSNNFTSSSSSPNCLNEDCSEVLKSNESNCRGTECSDNDREHPPTANEPNKTPFNATTLLSIKCDNRDPHHQRRLHRLAKVRMMNALHATAPIPTVPVRTDTGGDISTESYPKFVQNLSTAPPSEALVENTPPEQKLELVHQGFRPQQKLPQTETPVPTNRPRPILWFPPPTDSPEVDKIEHHEVPDPSDEEEDVSDSEMEPEFSNTNTNINTNFINLRRYLAGSRRKEGRTLTPVLQVSPPRKSYRRVVTKILNPPLLIRRTSENRRRESGAVLKEDIKPGKINLRAHGRRTVSFTRPNPTLYQRRSEDEAQAVRKRRSIIRVPQRASRRYRAL